MYVEFHTINHLDQDITSALNLILESSRRLNFKYGLIQLAKRIELITDQMINSVLNLDATVAIDKKFVIFCKKNHIIYAFNLDWKLTEMFECFSLEYSIERQFCFTMLIVIFLLHCFLSIKKRKYWVFFKDNNMN